MCRAIPKNKDLMGLDGSKYLKIMLRCRINKHRIDLWKKAKINNRKH